MRLLPDSDLSSLRFYENSASCGNIKSRRAFVARRAYAGRRGCLLIQIVNLYESISGGVIDSAHDRCVVPRRERGDDG
jgi:hypothetical protein